MIARLLVFRGVQFKNPFLKHGWYTGKKLIRSLSFENCNIQVFHFDVFESKAFEFLQSLFINGNANGIQLESMVFNPLCNIYAIYIDDTRISGIEHSVYSQRKHCEKSYSFTCVRCFPFNTSLSAWIHVLQLAGSLNTFYLETEELPKLTTLYANDFQGLYKLATLSFQNNGIEFITDGTFATFGNKLKHIYLQRNKIKNMRLSQFGIFATLGTNLFIGNNPIACDCDYFLLESVFIINARSVLRKNGELSCHHHLVGNDNIDNTLHSSQCNNIQSIHRNKLCFSVSSPAYFNYARINMKYQMEQNALIINRYSNKNYEYKFRVIMYNFKPSRQRRCKIDTWFKRLASCVLISNETQSININLDSQSDIMFISIMYLTADRVWPLHFITLRNMKVDQFNTNELSIIKWAIFIGLCIGAFILAFVLTIGQKIISEHKRMQSIFLYVNSMVYIS